ncbi:hypothetical protein HZA44_04665 [Candidatus Peregrinibacteria bacterium]|nr:hypothetical protein [Candidatus Peregrinibacteria bacterium]
MSENAFDSLANLDLGRWLDLVTAPSFKSIQLAVVVYFGLLWLTIIVWVTRDAINRSNSLLFQVFAILLNIVFPILGILLYLIIRPGKTTLERYYEDLEHRLILDSIHGKTEEGQESPHKQTHLKRIAKKGLKKEVAESDETPKSA